MTINEYELLQLGSYMYIYYTESQLSQLGTWKTSGF